MGYQVIRQPGTDRFGIFCSNTDEFAAWDATRSEVVEYFVEMAATEARERAERIVGFVADGETRKAYAQFALTWEEAVEKDYRHGGEMTAELEGDHTA
ncbi:hypothetical protein [Nocardia sp. NPDC060249]|uniref:hypothetical protein n=1 Tax=Nocardia sp. NPDC060249 TaxID=3347082 RepID=UPI00364EA349